MLLYSHTYNHFGKLFGIALLISFLGSLPLGTITTTCLQLSISHGQESALVFVLATVLVELVFVLVLLTGIRGMTLPEKFVKNSYPFAIGFILLLALLSFYGNESTSVSGSALHWNVKSLFGLGIIIGILNPFQIPFWLGWNSFFINKKWLKLTRPHIACYLMAIGIGSFFGVAVYAFSSSYIIDHLGQYSMMLNRIFAGVYLVLALYLSVHYFRKYHTNTLKNV